MDRKTELEQIIANAQTELSVIYNRKNTLRETEWWIKESHNRGVDEEELLGVIDLIYHPEHYVEDADL